MPEAKTPLDIVAQFYASTINDTNPCTFYLAAYLKETVNPHILQTAVNDLIIRLPFLNGRIKQDLFHHYNQYNAYQPNPIQIEKSNSLNTFTTCHKRGRDPLFKVLYNENGFKLETTHIICDGRAIVKIMEALLVRYYELQGISINKNGIIHCAEKLKPEELENAFEKYTQSIPAKDAREAFTRYTKAQNSGKPKTVYQNPNPNPANSRTITSKHSVKQLKAAAKQYNATITELITAYIFKAIAEERQTDTTPIAIMIPVDFRTFYPSETLGTFVQGKPIYMTEVGELPEILEHIKTQFKAITPESVSDEIIGFYKIFNFMKFIPLVIKRRILKIMKRSGSAGNTTMFSNLGLVKLPLEIEAHLSTFEFAICPESEYEGYVFSCVAVGDSLSLTISTNENGEDTVANLVKLLNNN